VLKRRVPRVFATGFVLAVAVSGLSACRTSPTVAAYVGDEQVTVAELESAVADRRDDPDIDAFAAGDPDVFSRRVLTLLVDEEVYAAAAQRYDVEVSNDEVRTRIDQLLGGDDPDAVYGQLATQGVGRADVFQNVRQQLVREQIATSEGQAEGLSEEALRAAYQQMLADDSKVRFGYITVPDPATATAVLAQLTATPDRYGEIAGQYAGDYTLAAVEERTPDQLPPPLVDQAVAAKPGTGFIVPVAEIGGVVVGFVAPDPTFEEVRPDLELQASDKAAEAGGALVEKVRADLGVTFNPRFGEFKDGQLVPSGGGVVELLEEKGEGGAEDLPTAPGPEGN
jgi:peptidyl-prolyl cis-trans isomerase SurA